MRSSLGYTEGEGAKIATHEIDMGDPLPEHHQKFAPGTGILTLSQIIAHDFNAIGFQPSSLISCKGAGRIVLAPYINDTGNSFYIIFYDKNKAEIGMSDTIPTSDIFLEPAFSNVIAVWEASTLVNASRLIRVDLGEGTFAIYAALNDGITGGSAPVFPKGGASVVDNEVTWLHIMDDSMVFAIDDLFVFSNSMGATYFRVAFYSVAYEGCMFAGVV